MILFDAVVSDRLSLSSIHQPQQVHGKSKLKKAFCEPGTISFCPPIALTQALVFESSTTLAPSSEFSITRPEANGGDKVFKNISEIQADFESGALHPGDLKAATTNVALLLLERLAAAFSGDSETQKAVKALKAFAKKMSKKK
jgi:tyrosyl-tRNA synthetase